MPELPAEPLNDSIAKTLLTARLDRDLSANALAERSGVSRAMISKIERGEAQPTAALLARLSGALGMTLSELVARAERGDRRLVRAAEQPTWVDPGTGYRRRAVSPVAGGPLELVEVDLPPGAEVSSPADAHAFIHQQIWVLDGHLRFREGDTTHELDAGDCLQLGPPAPCTYINPTRESCRYLVAHQASLLTRREPGPISEPPGYGGPMPYARDPRVDAYIDALPDWQQDICHEVRDLVHAADPEVTETIKRTVQPYFVLDGNICALLAAKDHVNVFMYDGGIVPDPESIITAGHENKSARTVAFRQGETINAPALTAMLKQIIANNRAGGWRKLKREQ